MKKVIKGLFLSFILIFTSIGIALGLNRISFSNFADWFSQTNSLVHFGNLGNDFGGMIFVTGTKNVTGIKVGGVECLQQLQGYYSIPTMGLTMLSLDGTSNKVGSVVGYKVEGGLYTMCEGYKDSIIGQVKWQLGSKVRYLTAGVKLNQKGNKILNGDFTNGFQFYQKRPVGLIHDSVLGIGFVGGKVNKFWYDSSKKANKAMSGFDLLVEKTNQISIPMNSLIEKIDTVGKEIVLRNHHKENGKPPVYISDGLLNSVLFKIGVLGTYNVGQMGFGKSDFQEGANNLNSISDNNTYESFNTAGANNTQSSFLLSTVKMGSEKICRNSRKDLTSTNNIINKEGTYCFKKNGTEDELVVTANLVATKDAIIVLSGKGGKLIFKKSQYGKGNLNVFVDEGVMLLDSSIDKVNLNKEGNFVAANAHTQGVLMRGIFFVRGIIGGYDGSNLGTINKKVFFRGNVVSYNSIYEPNPKMTTYINSLVGISNLSSYINLQDVFVWTCGTDGTGTDGANCNGGGKRDSKSIVFLNDPVNLMLK